MPTFHDSVRESHFQRIYNWAQFTLQKTPTQAYYLARSNTLKKYPIK